MGGVSHQESKRMTQREQERAKEYTDQTALADWTPQQLLQMQASLVELAHDVILVRDPASRIISWNRGAEELYGWSAEEAIGQITHDLLKTRFSDSQTVVDAALEDEGKWEGELTHTRRDGSLVVVESRQVLRRDEEGSPFVILEVNRDITARKAEMERVMREAERAQQQSRTLLRQSAQRLRLALRAGNIGIFEYDIARAQMLWTPELEALYGLSAGTFAGAYDDWMRLVHPDDRERVAASFQQALTSEASYDDEFRVIWPDGSIHWVFAKGEMVDYLSEGQPLRMIGVNIDITRLKEAEQKLQSLNADLEERVAERTLSLQQLNKELQRSNQELQDFAYVASHDLQEPLRKIQAFGNLLQEEYEPVLGEGKAYIDRMRSAATRMRVLIDDLLAFSRVTTHALPFHPVDLNTISAEVLSDLEVQIQSSGAQVEIGELPIIDADPLQMRQLLQNLLGNALKFHRPAVAPVIKVRAEFFTPSEQLASESASPSWCHILVEDNGIGFDERYLDRIFTVFQRLHGKNAYEGTGIGLAVVRKIAERHGGTVTAQSQVGQGSTFRVSLPITQLMKEEKQHGE